MAGNSADSLGPLDNPEDLARHVSNLFDQWKMARSVIEERWEEVRKYVHATSTRETDNHANPWDNSTHIPKLAQIADNLEANYKPALFPNEDWLTFEADDAEAANREIRQKILSYIKTKHTLSKFVPEIEKCLRDWIFTGNAFASVEWVEETTKDPLTGEQVTSYVGPRVRRISPYDIVFNPIASTFERSPKILRRIYSQGELHRLAEESPETWAEDVIAKIDSLRVGAHTASEKDIKKYSSIPFDGFGNMYAYLTSGYIEVLEFYGDIYDVASKKFLKNHRIVVVDRNFVALKEELTTWSGVPHIYHVPWRIRQDNLWGQGPLENLVGMQYRINHLENSKADAYDQQLDSDLVFVGNVDILEDGARKIYIVEDAQGSVSRLAPDTSILQANMEVQNIMNLMEEMAGAPRDAMGIRTPGEKTAFEVDQLYERANRVFQNKTNLFDRMFLEPIVNAEIELARQYAPTTDVVRVYDDEVGIIEFLEITQEELRSKGKLIPMGARNYAQIAKATQTIATLQQTIMTDPSVSVHISGLALAKAVTEDILSLDKYNLFHPYIRISEQAEAMKFQAAAEQEIMEQDMMMAEGIAEEDFGDEL